MKYYKPQNKENSTISFINIIIIFSIALPIILFTSNFYYNFQKSVFSNSASLLFISNKLTGFIIVFSPIVILFCITLSIKINTSIRIMKVKIFLFISIMIFIISFTILLCSFFEYTDISKNGICVRNGVFSTNKNYMWSDVTNAEVSYKHGYKNEMTIIYNIHLNDGTIVNAANSKEFFNNIISVDDFMKNKKIKIIRSGVKPGDYDNLTKSYDDPNIKQVMVEILDQ